MASKVNTKFVVGLGAGLLVVCAGVAGTAYYLLKNTASDNARAADAKFAAGQFNEAAELYSKAVNKEQTNSAYLTKWIDALSKSTADTDTKYAAMHEYIVRAKRSLAVLQPDNVAAQREYLDLVDRMLRSGGLTDEAHQRMASEADSIIALHSKDAPGPWEVLKRYRGMANIAIYNASPGSKGNLLAPALTDLESASKADPKDDETVLTLAETHLRKAADADDHQDKALAAEEEKKADDLLSAFLVNNPDSPPVLLALIQRDILRTQKWVRDNPKAKKPEELATEFRARNAPLLDRALTQAKKGKLPVKDDLLQQLRGLELLTDGKLSRTEELTRECLKAKPTDPAMLAYLGDLLSAKGDYQGAMEQFEKLANLPVPPISFEGMQVLSMQKSALSQQAVLGLKAAQQLTDPAAKQVGMDKAKALRATLASKVNADDERLILVDAMVAMTEDTPEKTTEAAQLLDQYHRKTNRRNPEALYYAAQLAYRMNQRGLAVEYLTRAVELQPSNITALTMLGGLHQELQNFDDARVAFSRVLQLDPTNEVAKKSLDLVNAVTNQGESTDPVIRLISQAESMRKGKEGDPANDKLVADMLAKGWKDLKDPRIAGALAVHLRGMGEHAKSSDVLAEGMKAFPNDKTLASIKASFENTDPVAAAIQQIDASSASPIEKALQKYTVYSQSGDRAKAEPLIEEASKLAPDDKRVIEMVFIRAIEQGKFDDARAMSDKAVRINADEVQGDTYRARLVAAQGDTKQAVSILQGAVKRGAVQPEVHRLLGRVLSMDARPADAAEAFRESLHLRPNDVPTAVDLITILIGSGRNTEALAAAREYKKYGQTDMRFIPLWLGLEAQVGDRDEARRRRELIWRASPTNRENALALAQLNIEDNKFDQASPIIDAVRAKSDGLDAAAMDANLRWRTGKIQEAKDLLNKYIASLNNPTSAPARFYAGFLLDHNDLEGAKNVLEGVRDRQDPKTLEVDRAISDLHTRGGRMEAALEASLRVVQGNADTQDKLYQKRAVELLTTMNRVDDAEKELAVITKAGTPDVVTLLLTAQLREAQKNPRAQLEALNEAVAKFPNEPLAFLRRGELFSKDAKTLKDAEADFTRAIELAPQASLYFQRRAAVRGQMNNTDAQISDMREAIRRAPRDNELFFSTLTTLSRMGKHDEVAQITSEIAEQRTRESAFMAGLGSFFTSLAKNSDVSVAARNTTLSRRYWERAADLDPSDFNTLNYLTALLNTPPEADTVSAERAITKLGERGKKHPGYIMAQARVRLSQGKNAESIRLTQEALRIIDTKDAAQMRAWNADFSSIMTTRSEKINYFESVARAGLAADWMQFFRAAELLSEKARQSEGLTGLQQVLASSKTPALRQIAFSELGTAYFTMGQYEQAAKAWGDGSAEFPQSAELANNAAFVNIAHLQKFEAGLALAEKAVAANPNDPDMLDTLGLAYLRLNRNKEAIMHLERALVRMQRPESGAIIAVHLTEALLADNNKEGAKRAIKTVDGILEQVPTALDQTLKDKLQELRTQVEAK